MKLAVIWQKLNVFYLMNTFTRFLVCFYIKAILCVASLSYCQTCESGCNRCSCCSRVFPFVLYSSLSIHRFNSPSAVCGRSHYSEWSEDTGRYITFPFKEKELEGSVEADGWVTVKWTLDLVIYLHCQAQETARDYSIFWQGSSLPACQIGQTAAQTASAAAYCRNPSG